MEKINLSDFFSRDQLTTEVTETAPITLWIPIEYKEKFQELQMKTRKEFGRRVQELIVMSTDLAMKELEK